MRPKDSPFIVLLRDIPPEGKRLGLDLTGDWTRAALAGLELPWAPGDRQLRADVELFKVQSDVVARGTLRGPLTVPCSRCAEPARLDLAAGFTSTFVPEGKLLDDEDASAGEKEMAAEQADVATYRDEEVDLEDTLRQQLLLALPYAPLCAEACKGLCPRCGKNLNEGPCSCGPTEKLPKGEGRDPWAALRNIKL